MIEQSDYCKDSGINNSVFVTCQSQRQLLFCNFRLGGLMLGFLFVKELSVLSTEITNKYSKRTLS